jgi:hypothetical protein
VAKSINEFGNLMSSAIIYDDSYGCQAFLEALKNQRLVWSRGRFRKPPKKKEEKESEERSEFVSNLTTGFSKLETNSDERKPTRGSRVKSRCPECGGTNTKYRGRIGGDWRKVRSETTGQVYWRWFGEGDQP